NESERRRDPQPEKPRRRTRREHPARQRGEPGDEQRTGGPARPDVEEQAEREPAREPSETTPDGCGQPGHTDGVTVPIISDTVAGILAGRNHMPRIGSREWRDES